MFMNGTGEIYLTPLLRSCLKYAKCQKYACKRKRVVKRRGGGREGGVISKPPIDEMDGSGRTDRLTFLFFPSHFLEGAGVTQREGGRNWRRRSDRRAFGCLACVTQAEITSVAKNHLERCSDCKRWNIYKASVNLQKRDWALG